MEKRLSTKCNDYFKSFKYDIKKYIDENITLDAATYNNLMQYIFDYNTITITKKDFTKRKRVKNTVPLHERCCALRASGEQCTRRRKEFEKFCGTHIKGTPHGEISNSSESTSVTMKKKEIWAQDIGGIIYYIDDDSNVYDHTGIINNIVDPKIIAKYNKTTENVFQNGTYVEKNTYNIPSLFEKKE